MSLPPALDEIAIPASALRQRQADRTLPFTTLFAFFLLLLAWPLHAARAEDDRAVLTDGRGSALWWSTDRGALLESKDGTTWEVDLQPDVRWTSLAVEPGAWSVAGRKGEDRLVLIQGQGDRSELMASPRHGGKLLGDPVLLAASNEAQGLAWLEGETPRSLSVRAAMLRPDGWTISRVVAAPGPGTQTALAATRLSDGRHLLLWSAFDGNDDEIHWSLGQDGSWSRASRLGPDNRYPDITPAVVAMEDGQALAAWSSYDGRVYRLVLSHFDGQRWGPRFSQSASADLFPDFTTLGSHTILQAKDPVENRWTLVMIGPRGEALERTTAEATRPVVVAASSEGLELRSLDRSNPEQRAWIR